MSLSSQVLIKVRKARGRKPKFSVKKGESLASVLMRTGIANQMLSHTYPKDITMFPLFYLTNGEFKKKE
jgi:hypothetical protein